VIYPFPGEKEVPLKVAGGKGRSLVLMAARGLPVPPGLVLGVDFFSAWWEELHGIPEWKAFQEGDDLKSACQALKQRARACRFTAEQKEELEKALPDCQLFAVRSSSPEEDLAGSSFAGLYETILGVTRETLEGAVAAAFASCLDARVAVYKQEQGFDPRSPRIAVVVQKQVASETAGVGFSLNPITNDYDEAVLNANFGLGETVVAGLATPDTYRVDRMRRVILERLKGSKETSLFLNPDGGTDERPSPFKDELALTDAQILEVAELVTQVAESYGHMIDIEWAYEDAQLYLLQARPVTTQLQLPPGLLTRPGDPRRLYLDATISVQGLMRPMSVMGTSVLRRFLTAVTQEVFGRDLADPDENFLVTSVCGRLYGNLTNLFGLVSRERFCSVFSIMDPVATETILNLDPELYPASDSLAGVRLDLLWNVPGKLLHVVEARLMPDSAYQRAQTAAEEHLQALRALQHEPLDKFAAELFPLTAKLLFNYMVPVIVVGRLARARLAALFPTGHQEDLDRLDRALPGNVTVEMGLELNRLAQLLPADITAEELKREIPAGEFSREWSSFLERYGHRGPRELDIAAPRYRDQPGMLLEQLVQLRGVEDKHAEHAAARAQAQARLAEAVKSQGWLRSAGFNSLAKVWERLGGMRETPKFWVIKGLDMLRTRLLSEGRRLVDEGRLDQVEDIWDLQLEDLQDPTLDLRARRSERRAFQASFERCRELPRLIDSRGRICNPPPRPAKPGEVAGIAISAGVARGPVKALHAPDEKPVLPGDILVARATDPGWTPLFVHAAAVVLEVGGMLQHGALVAREYGKPCVAGVAGAVELWEDGTVIEVDGTSGIIRKINPTA